MTVLDLPDSGLKEMNPIKIEGVIEEHIEKIKPDVIVTYAVHGVSGFEDHLVSHAVVKRLFCELKEKGSTYPKRLALFTHYTEEDIESKFNLKSSDIEEIDCWVETDETDRQKFLEALDCYETYQQVIEDSGVKQAVGKRVPFEIFGEQFETPLESITEKLD
jgi:LmbE family N-acetylglucosaminyl deacetylase